MPVENFDVRVPPLPLQEVDMGNFSVLHCSRPHYENDSKAKRGGEENALQVDSLAVARHTVARGVDGQAYTRSQPNKRHVGPTETLVPFKRKGMRRGGLGRLIDPQAPPL